MKKTVSLALAAVLAAAMLLSSCDSFFSGSFGKFRSYDPRNIDLGTTDRVDDWVERAVGNKPLSAALLTAIEWELTPPPSDTNYKARLIKSGTKIVGESAGLGASLVKHGIKNITNMIDDDSGTDDQKEILDVLDKVFQDFKNNGGTAQANQLAEMLASDISGGTTPTFSADYKAEAEPGEVAEAIVTLALALANDLALDSDDFAAAASDPNPEKFWKDEFADKLTNFSIASSKVTYSGNAAKEKVLAAYVNLIVDDSNSKFDGNPVTDAIKKALTNNNS